MNDFQLLLTLLKPYSPWLLFVSYMMHTLVHTWKRPGCSIFKEINVKRHHSPGPFMCPAHIHYSAQQNYF